jgi:hypothetical protein
VGYLPDSRRAQLFVRVLQVRFQASLSITDWSLLSALSPAVKQQVQRARRYATLYVQCKSLYLCFDQGWKSLLAKQVEPCHRKSLCWITGDQSTLVAQGHFRPQSSLNTDAVESFVALLITLSTASRLLLTFMNLCC